MPPRAATSGVANYDGGVTELDARDGRWVRTLSSTRYGFNDPRPIAAAGNHAWVANLLPVRGGGSVTETEGGDGGWVQTFVGRVLRLRQPGRARGRRHSSVGRQQQHRPDGRLRDGR